MANIFEPTPRQKSAYKSWISSRPPRVRKVAERFFPWKLYRMKSTGQRVTVYSFGEGDGPVTLTVVVSGQFNAVAFERQVFGIDPDDLTECDLPNPNETVGSAMTPEDVAENLDELRLMIRPDLWVRRDGKVVPKNGETDE